MYIFLLPLLLGFTFNSLSAFTAWYSRRWGERAGRLLTVLLRDILGIPLWVLGLALAMRVEAPRLFDACLAGDIISWVLLLGGSALITWGLFALRGRAAAPSIGDSLVMQGPYAHIRHPLHSGMFLQLGGLFLYVPTVPALVACLLAVGWILVQSRLEEIDLVQRLPAYAEYMERVPRFLPRLRRQ